MYRIDLEHLTIITTDEKGETWDLNGGAPCETIGELRRFVNECCSAGAFGADVRDALLSQVPDYLSDGTTLPIATIIDVDGRASRIHVVADLDGRFRWYDEEGRDLECSGATVSEAIAAARACWSGPEWILEIAG
jgi:hypothetical protein